MCVYASGKRDADRPLRRKYARGRPRPPGLDDRSMRPLPSSAVRCFNVAIFDMRNSCERSVRETEPWRFRDRRICLFADENPASSAPTSTSLAGVIAAERRPEIIYLMIYKINVGRCRRREHGPDDLGRSL